MIIGDFNAKIGKRKDNQETKVGEFGLGERNIRGDRMVNYLETNKMWAMNTFFKKRPGQKWTWRSPDFKYKNEIDYILSDHPLMVQDVSVINKINTGSDHRLVRSKVLVNISNGTIWRKSYKKTHGVKIIQNKEEYERKIQEKLRKSDTTAINNITGRMNELVRIIREATDELPERKKAIEKKISDNTKSLFEKRRNLKVDKDKNLIEWAELNKLIRKELRKDIRKHNTKIIKETIEKNRGPKIFKKHLSLGKREMISLKDGNNEILTDRADISREVEAYYTDLYSSKVRPNKDQIKELKAVIRNVGSEDIPEFTTDEIYNALKKIKNNKAAGPDGIIPEMLKYAGPELIEELKETFNSCLETGQIPESWMEAEVILIHKKGDITKLNNYRPISLLSQIYKLFTRVLTNRLTLKIDRQQPREQAGFRSGFSTMDHLHTVNNLIEKCNEYNLKLYMAFIDYEKAFDTIEIWAVLNSMTKHRIDSRYTKLIENIYSQASMYVLLPERTARIPIQRGVRQGDTISPKLFIAALESVFSELNWSSKGVNVNGEYLNHLRFADDILIISNDAAELQEMIKELDNHSKLVGLTININKTKIMSNTNEQINITLGDQLLEKVEHYIYLGQTITTAKDRMNEEISRRIKMSWIAFGKLSSSLTSKLPNTLKRKLYDQCILPVLTYGAETWSLTKKHAQRIARTQRAQERRMLGIKLSDRKNNEWIREQTRITEVMERVAELKWKWAGHVARRMDDRWTKLILEWRPRLGRRSAGRPITRWRDDIRERAGTQWMRRAGNRWQWHEMGKAYIQQWIDIGRS